MTAAEEAQWLAYYQKSPFGDQRDDLRSAQVTQMIHNANSKKPKKLMDFMLFTDKPKPVGDTAEEIRRNFDLMVQRQKR